MPANARFITFVLLTAIASGCSATQSHLQGSWQSYRKTRLESPGHYQLKFTKPHHLVIEEFNSRGEPATLYDGDYQIKRGDKGQDILITSDGEDSTFTLLFDKEDLFIQGPGAPIRFRKVPR